MLGNRASATGRQRAFLVALALGALTALAVVVFMRSRLELRRQGPEPSPASLPREVEQLNSAYNNRSLDNNPKSEPTPGDADAVQITGSVIEQTSGQGLGGISLQFSETTGVPNRKAFTCTATSDAQGMIRIAAPKGAVDSKILCNAIAQDSAGAVMHYGAIVLRDGFQVVIPQRVTLSGSLVMGGDVSAHKVRLEYSPAESYCSTPIHIAHATADATGRFQAYAYIRDKISLVTVVVFSPANGLKFYDTTPLESLITGTYRFVPRQAFHNLSLVNGNQEPVEGTILIERRGDLCARVACRRDRPSSVSLQCGDYEARGIADGVIGAPISINFSEADADSQIVCTVSVDSRLVRTATITATGANGPASNARVIAMPNSLGDDVGILGIREGQTDEKGKCKLVLNSAYDHKIIVRHAALGFGQELVTAGPAPCSVDVRLGKQTFVRVQVSGSNLIERGLPSGQIEYIAVDKDGRIVDSDRAFESCLFLNTRPGWYSILIRGKGLYGEWNGAIRDGFNDIEVPCQSSWEFEVSVTPKAAEGCRSLCLEKDNWPQELQVRWATKVSGPGTYMVFGAGLTTGKIRALGTEIAVTAQLGLTACIGE